MLSPCANPAQSPLGVSNVDALPVSEFLRCVITAADRLVGGSLGLLNESAGLVPLQLAKLMSCERGPLGLILSVGSCPAEAVWVRKPLITSLMSTVWRP